MSRAHRCTFVKQSPAWGDWYSLCSCGLRVAAPTEAEAWEATTAHEAEPEPEEPAR